MAYSLFIIVLLAVAKLSLVFTSNLEGEYDHSAWLEPNEIYKLYWSVNHADKSIKFAAEVKTTGWVGFGISKGLTRNMIGADIAIGWVDSAGKGFIKVGEDAHIDFDAVIVRFDRNFCNCGERLD